MRAYAATLRLVAIVALGLFGLGCGSPVQPPPLSPSDPADPRAAESASGPLEPELMREAADSPPQPQAEKPHQHGQMSPEAHHHPPASPLPPPQGDHSGHGHHPSPGEVSAKPDEAASFVCPSHPEVKQGSPGKCPIDGKDLIPVKKPPKEPSR